MRRPRLLLTDLGEASAPSMAERLRGELEGRLAAKDPPAPGLIVVDSVSTLLVLLGARRTYGLLMSLVAAAREHDCTTWLLTDPAMHTPEERAAVRHLADIVLTVGHDRSEPRLVVHAADLSPEGVALSFSSSADGLTFATASPGGRIR